MEKITIFNMAAVRHLEFKTFLYLVIWLSSSYKSAVLYQISSKSDDFSLIYSNLTIFKMVNVRQVSATLNF